MDHEPIQEDLQRLWIKFNSRFKDLVYPTLFQPFGISFNVAYQVWSMAGLSETQSGPPGSVFEEIQDEEDDSEAWKG